MRLIRAPGSDVLRGGGTHPIGFGRGRGVNVPEVARCFCVTSGRHFSLRLEVNDSCTDWLVQRPGQRSSWTGRARVVGSSGSEWVVVPGGFQSPPGHCPLLCPAPEWHSRSLLGVPGARFGRSFPTLQHQSIFPLQPGPGLGTPSKALKGSPGPNNTRLQSPVQSCR